jgi:hypothetical protein
MLLYKDGITMDVPELDSAFYLRAGYKKVDEPVTIPAKEKHAGGRPRKSEEPEPVKDGEE